MNFKIIFKFEYKRSFLESLIFYTVWCILLVLFVLLLSFTLSFVYAIASVFGFIKLPQGNMENIIGELSHYIPVIICLIVTFLVIYKKKVYSAWRILFFIITMIICFSSSALYGFIFTSILTMFPSKVQINTEN